MHSRRRRVIRPSSRPGGAHRGLGASLGAASVVALLTAGALAAGGPATAVSGSATDPLNCPSATPSEAQVASVLRKISTHSAAAADPGFTMRLRVGLDEATGVSGVRGLAAAGDVGGPWASRLRDAVRGLGTREAGVDALGRGSLDTDSLTLMMIGDTAHARMEYRDDTAGFWAYSRIMATGRVYDRHNLDERAARGALGVLDRSTAWVIGPVEEPVDSDSLKEFAASWTGGFEIASAAARTCTDGTAGAITLVGDNPSAVEGDTLRLEIRTDATGALARMDQVISLGEDGSISLTLTQTYGDRLVRSVPGSLRVTRSTWTAAEAAGARRTSLTSWATKVRAAAKARAAHAHRGVRVTDIRKYAAATPIKAVVRTDVAQGAQVTKTRVDPFIGTNPLIKVLAKNGKAVVRDNW